MYSGILRWLLVALLLTMSDSHLLAQQRNLGVGISEAREQRLALTSGNSAGEAAQAKHGVDDANGRSRRGVLQLVLAPAATRSQKSAPRAKEAQRRAPGTVFRDCAGCPEMVVIPPGDFTPGSANGEAGQ
ncbi:MAG: hypothetical protein ABIH03_12310, partial [Pseudomonadota bacterium]